MARSGPALRRGGGGPARRRYGRPWPPAWRAEPPFARVPGRPVGAGGAGERCRGAGRPRRRSGAVRRPRAAVGSEADAVEGQPRQRAAMAVFGGEGSDMGVVVADGDGGMPCSAAKSLGQAGGGEIGMEVVGDEVGFSVEDGQQVGGCLRESRWPRRCPGRRCAGRGKPACPLAAHGVFRWPPKGPAPSDRLPARGWAAACSPGRGG